MKNIPSFSKIVAFVVIVLASNWVLAQDGTPIAFGQTVIQEHPTPSDTYAYLTPFAQPGDVLFIRVSGMGMAPKFQLFFPLGAVSVGTYTAFVSGVAQAIYPIPPGVEPGNFTIVVSDYYLLYTGSFCISIERMNNSPASVFLPCSQSLTSHLVCGGALKSFRYLVHSGAISRITVSPDPGNRIAPEVWVCDVEGNILQHKSTTYGLGLVLDSIPAQITGCYDVFVTDALGYYEGGFSIVHNVIAGNCAAGALTTNTPSNTICEGSPFSIGITGALPNSTFQWTGPNGFISDQSQISFPQIMPGMSGTYAVTVTSPTVCSSVFSKTITVNPLPTVDGSVDPESGSICIDEIFTLDVTTNAVYPVSYHWTGPGFSSTQKSPTIFGQDTTISGLYIISVTDGKGCINKDTIPVIVHAPPTVAISQPANGGVCHGSTLQLFAQTNASASVASFSWTGPNGFSSTLQNPQIPNATSANVGTYSVTVTAYECSDYGSKYISVWNLPMAGISPSSPSICLGDSIKLTASGGILYEWPTGETTKEIIVRPLETNTYSVTVIDSRGCNDDENTTVTVDPLPSISVTSEPASAEICSDSGQILLSVMSDDANNPIWEWTKNGSFFSNNQFISLSESSQSGIYTASVTDGITGCSSMTLPDTVNIFQTPTVNISHGTTPPYYPGDDLILCAGSNATGPSYEWEGPNGFTSSSACAMVSNLSLPNAGIYSVTVTDIHGCQGFADAEIEIIVGTVEPAEAWGLTIAPNPSDGIAQIRTDQPFSGKLEMVLFDANGRRIRSFWMETPTLTLDLTDLANGFYILRISDGEKAGAMRLAVIR